MKACTVRESQQDGTGPYEVSRQELARGGSSSHNREFRFQSKGMGSI